jgi:hypothetical protein
MPEKKPRDTPRKSLKKPTFASRTPPSLLSLTLNPEGVTAGESSTGTVTLTGPAPLGGVKVSLSTNIISGPYNVTASTKVTVAAGATNATFRVTTYPFDAPVFGIIEISAYLAPITQTQWLSVFPPLVKSLELVGSATGGDPLTGRVILTGLAPSKGADVYLSSNNMAVATVPEKVTVAAGTYDKSFPVTTFPVTATTSVVISANRLPFDVRSATLSVLPPALRALICDPAKGGATSIGTVFLTGPATAGGIVVNLASDNTAVITVPANIRVKAGTTKASFFTKTKRVSQPVLVSISASYGGVTLTDTIIVDDGVK